MNDDEWGRMIARPLASAHVVEWMAELLEHPAYYFLSIEQNDFDNSRNIENSAWLAVKVS